MESSSRNDTYENAACRYCGAMEPEVALFCNNCGRFLFSFGRVKSLLFILSVLTSLVLFRVTHSIWPVYLLVAAGIIHLYAVIFTRGEALTGVTVLFTLVTLAWVGWVVVEKLFITDAVQTIEGPIGSFLLEGIPRLPFVVSVILWLGGTIWAILLGRRKAIPGVKIASSYFLGTGAFIFGLWAVWAILLESKLFREWVFQLVVLIALIVPLALLVFLLRRSPPKGSRSQVVALWLLVIAAYLASTQFLTDIVEKGLGSFLPKLLGLPSLGGVDLPWLIGILRWRIPVCSLLSAMAIVSLVAASVALAVAAFTSVKPKFYVDAMAKVNNQKEEISRKIGRTRGNLRSGSQVQTRADLRYTLFQSEIERIAYHIMGMVLEVVLMSVTVARLARDIAIAFLDNLWVTLKRVFIYLRRLVRYLVLPVSSFSLLSILIILTLSHYQAYIVGTGVWPARSLWGEAITVMFGVLLLCGASFGFAPAIERRFVFAGTEAVAYLGGMLYVLLSLASLGYPLIWFGFQSADISFSAVRPGPIYATNLVASIGLLFVLMLTVAPTVLPSSIVQRIRRFDSILSALPVAFLALFLGVALLYGLKPIVDGLSSALA